MRPEEILAICVIVYYFILGCVLFKYRLRDGYACSVLLMSTWPTLASIIVAVVLHSKAVGVFSGLLISMCISVLLWLTQICNGSKLEFWRL